MHVLTLLVVLFIIQPIAEYWLHRLAHWAQLTYHLSHHKFSSHGRFWGYQGDWTCQFLIAMLALCGWYTAALTLLKYEASHTIVHRTPGLRYLHRHHFLHHRHPSKNFSFSAIWPDRLFGTLEI